MTRFECRIIGAELADYAREGRALPAALRSHVLVCAECSGRWEAEVALSAGLAEFGKAVRSAQPSFGQRAAMRSALLEKFDAQTPRRTARPWWGVAAAAAVLLAVGGGMVAMYRAQHAPVAVTLSEDSFDAQTEAQEAGFIAVPYVPPLAPGELVHVVHTQLQPAELASLGVNVDPTLSADMPADLLVGADGFPRAVRISEEALSDGGY